MINILFIFLLTVYHLQAIMQSEKTNVKIIYSFYIRSVNAEQQKGR